jgi:hypothetical protein
MSFLNFALMILRMIEALSEQILLPGSQMADLKITLSVPKF